MSVKVYIWLPKSGRVGHSSMLVGSETYISFWPGQNRKGFFRSIISTLTINVKRRPFYRDYAADCAAEEFEPLEVELSTLNENAIQKYWEKVQASELAYELTEFNCSTIIANALYFGSGLQPSFLPLAEVDDYVGMGIPLGQVEAWEPKNIWQYAKELKRKEK
jgi:hypothetical protein